MVTRASSGLSGLTSHRAKPRRLFGAPAGSGAGWRESRAHGLAGLVVRSADQQMRLFPDRTFGHDHHSGKGTFQLLLFQAECCELAPGFPNFLRRGVLEKE